MTRKHQPGDWVSILAQVVEESTESNVVVWLFSKTDQYQANVSPDRVEKINPPEHLAYRCTSLFRYDTDAFVQCTRHEHHAHDHGARDPGGEWHEWGAGTFNLEANNPEKYRQRPVDDAPVPKPDEKHTVHLDDYERDNLLHALYAAVGLRGTERSPLFVLNTGDWLMQVVYKLRGLYGDEEPGGTPNFTYTQLAKMAREFT